MIIKENSVVQHVNHIKNGIMINVNMSVKAVKCAEKIIARILAHVFVRIISI